VTAPPVDGADHWHSATSVLKSVTMRRMAGALFGTIEYFVDTDFSNLFLSNTVAGMGGAATTQLKATPGMNIQDAYATYKASGDMFKVDVGYILTPLSHNALQGATGLYSWDYFANTFRHNGTAANAFVFGATASPVGRDVGVQEYRFGLFQGLRDAQTATEVGSRNFFRAAARVQVNLMDPETGFFYAGTYRGTKQILSFGSSYDFHDAYKYFAVDGILDMPSGPGVATAQVNVTHWDGGTFVPLPSQTAVMGEAGFLLASLPVSPMVRYGRAGRESDQPAVAGLLLLESARTNPWRVKRSEWRTTVPRWNWLRGRCGG